VFSPKGEICASTTIDGSPVNVLPTAHSACFHSVTGTCQANQWSAYRLPAWSAHVNMRPRLQVGAGIVARRRREWCLSKSTTRSPPSLLAQSTTNQRHPGGPSPSRSDLSFTRNALKPEAPRRCSRCPLTGAPESGPPAEAPRRVAALEKPRPAPWHPAGPPTGKPAPRAGASTACSPWLAAVGLAAERALSSWRSPGPAGRSFWPGPCPPALSGQPQALKEDWSSSLETALAKSRSGWGNGC